MTCPCGKPATYGPAYWRPRDNPAPPRFCCSARCLDKLVELRGRVPNERIET